MSQEDPQVRPLSSQDGNHSPRRDEESGNTYKLVSQNNQTRRRKFLVYILALTVILAVLFLTFAMVVRPKTPKFRVTDVTVKSLDVKGSNANLERSSLNGTLLARMAIENSNFGPFEYGNGTLRMVYRGIGEAAVFGQEVVVAGRPPARGTGWVDLSIDLGSGQVSDVGYKSFNRDVGSGEVNFDLYGTLSGRVHLAGNRLKRWKTCELNCNMWLELSTQKIRGLVCK